MISYSLIVIICIFLLFIIRINVCNLYVELSAASLSYYIYLPIVVKAWKLCGYKSIVFLLYYNLSNSIIYIGNELIKLGSDVIFLRINYTLSLHYTSKLARIYGFEVSRITKNCDYMILSDSDMIPISKSFFSDINYGKLTIKSFGPNGYGFGNNKGRWAMCYIIANKYIWKEIFNKDMYNKNIDCIMSDTLNYLVQKGEKYFENFIYLDEVYIRDRIREWKMFNTNVLFHTRNYNNTRIDRYKWSGNFFKINKTNIIDVHLPKIPKSKKNIKDIWINSIIPLQQYIFDYTPFGLQYIENLLKLDNNFE